MARIISEVRPRYAFVENSPMLTSRGLGTVLADLAKMGFDARWCVLGAADVGANHQRNRIWIKAERNNYVSHAKLHRTRRWEQQQESIKEANGNMANTAFIGLETKRPQQQTERTCGKSKNMADTDKSQCKGNECTERIKQEYSDIGKSSWWQTEPNICRVADGVAARVDRLKAIGNGQVPLCAATAWRILNAS
jgi:DNA (cytosine-5)-methyltransferase 1